MFLIEVGYLEFGCNIHWKFMSVDVIHWNSNIINTKRLEQSYNWKLHKTAPSGALGSFS